MKDLVYIDTSYFETQNFTGGKINDIMYLSEKEEIQIILPQLTIDEIHHRSKENIDKASKALKSVRKEVRILNSNIHHKETFRFNPREELSRVKDDLNSIVSKSNVLIIPYDQKLKVEEIFQKYLDVKPPFSESKRKEFADAFNLHFLDSWCIENGKTIKIITNDNDLKNYASNSDQMELIEEVDVFIDSKIKAYETQVRIDLEEDYFNSIVETVQQEFRDHLIDEIGNNLRYSEYHGNIIEEVNSVEVGESTIHNVFTLYSGDTESKLEIVASIPFKATLKIENYDSAIYDKEDDKWYNLDYVNVTIDDTFDLTFDLVLHLNQEGSEFEDYEITEIHNFELPLGDEE